VIGTQATGINCKP